MPEPVTTLLNRASIILLGTFNPSIFQPSWFARHSLLREPEADQAELKMIHPQLAHFTTEWLEVQVTRDRFMALSRNGGFEAPLVDLVSGTFSILEHTPLSSVGMNREVKLQFDTTDRWHRFGHTLVPKDAWRDILPNPGLSGVQMKGERSGRGDAVNLFVTSTGERRVDIDINEHRNAPEAGSALSVIGVLRNEWEGALNESERIARYLIDLVSKD